jgi:fumarate hydratase, class II
VNPVMSEAVTMVAAQVMGNQTTITVGGMGGYFELNLMMPVIAYAMEQSIGILANVSVAFAEKAVDGIVANEDRCRELLEKNASLATALAPLIGYDSAATIAKEAFKQKRTVREVAREKGVIGEEELEKVLDPRPMTEPGLPGK